MPGDERVRHCPQCNLDVYNFSEMTESEIARLVKTRTGRVCARFYQRADGTMLERNCAPTPSAVSKSPLLATAALTALVGIVPMRVTATPQCQAANSPAAHSVAQILSVVVHDPSGAPISGAAVSLVNTQTGERFEAKTDETGEFSTSTLPSGTYDLTVRESGFATFVQKSVVTPSHISATLWVALMGEVVFIQPQLTTVEEPTTLIQPSDIETPRTNEGSGSALTISAETTRTSHRSALRRFFSKLRSAF